ncbi:D,D-heptose 1,7-bisphosphate phosphatase [Lysobacter sp. Root916]|uniref:D-glycero-alpha-D-manno-heptose-1,7-bisphosphate 7-phosphatase n=1 Tax=Lysobacter sp. Root916 TaxID=1736606 RepID=UPI000708AAD4|nr:HAD family hydrolase [Lysobacter sp. Root916]KRD34052.1 D,D-heptose 1,7-bisphosphate phosphatase [Lysobacter sp. Root916]
MAELARALFLDRDGVVNRDEGYTHRWEDFVFIDGIFDLCRAARAQGYRLFVVTNQAGIGRGRYTEQDFLALTERMCEAFAAEGAPIDRVYFDPTHPEHGIGDYRRESPMRKPNPGMLLAAAQEFGVSLADSLLVGDKPSDILAGQRAGLATTLLYRPPGAAAAEEPGQGEVVPTAVIDRLRQAIDWL